MRAGLVPLIDPFLSLMMFSFHQPKLALFTRDDSTLSSHRVMWFYNTTIILLVQVLIHLVMFLNG